MLGQLECRMSWRFCPHLKQLRLMHCVPDTVSRVRGNRSFKCLDRCAEPHAAACIHIDQQALRNNVWNAGTTTVSSSSYAVVELPCLWQCAASILRGHSTMWSRLPKSQSVKPGCSALHSLSLSFTKGLGLCNMNLGPIFCSRSV